MSVPGESCLEGVGEVAQEMEEDTMSTKAEKVSETCEAETHSDCQCCQRCHGEGQCVLLSGIEWDYSGPDYGTCPSCGGTGRR